MPTTDLPDWIKPGSTVYVCNQRGITDTYRPQKVDRLTSTQIVLGDGSKFRRADLRMVGGDGRERLADPSDPAVSRTLRSQAEDRALSALTFQITQYGRYSRRYSDKPKRQVRAELAALMSKTADMLAENTED